MGHYQKSDIQLAIESLEQDLNLFAGFRIETSSWFVRNNYFWMSHDRASDANALFLAAGQLTRIANEYSTCDGCCYRQAGQTRRSGLLQRFSSVPGRERHECRTVSLK